MEFHVLIHVAGDWRTLTYASNICNGSILGDGSEFANISARRWPLLVLISS